MTRTPRATWRRLMVAAATAGVAVLASGCMRLDVTMTVSEDDTVSGAAVIAFSDEIAHMFGMDDGAEMFEAMQEQGVSLGDALPGATAADYEQDGFTGQRFTLDAVPTSEFRDEDLSIVLDGDTVTLTARIDLTANTSPDTELERLIARTFESGISVTFPGRVTEANGEVSGNTVTWTPTFGTVTELHAVASATPSAGLPWWVPTTLAGVVLVVSAGAVTTGLRQRGKNPSEDHDAEDTSTATLDDHDADEAVQAEPGPVPHIEITTRRQARAAASASKPRRGGLRRVKRDAPDDLVVPVVERPVQQEPQQEPDSEVVRNSAWDDYVP